MTDKSNELLPKSRMESLCDGIFAIAMTLIILDLKTPENVPTPLEKDRLPAILLDLLPEAETYAISFIILGVFWLRHVIQLKYIKFVDRKIIAINLIFLLLIGFVPFTTGVLMRYPDYNLSFILYSSNLLLISLLLTTQWFYASSIKEIVSEELTHELKKMFVVFSTVPALIFLCSLIVSFFSIRIAFFLLYLDPLFYLIYRRMIKRRH